MNAGSLLLPPSTKPQVTARKATSPKPRGFAAMDPAKRKELASKGGKTAQASGKGHRMTQEEARVAGSIGGKRSRRGPAKAKASA